MQKCKPQPFSAPECAVEELKRIRALEVNKAPPRLPPDDGVAAPDPAPPRAVGPVPAGPAPPRRPPAAAAGPPSGHRVTNMRGVADDRGTVGTYTGQVDGNFVPHGAGRMEYRSGRAREGVWSGGRFVLESRGTGGVSSAEGKRKEREGKRRSGPDDGPGSAAERGGRRPRSPPREPAGAGPGAPPADAPPGRGSRGLGLGRFRSRSRFRSPRRSRSGGGDDGGGRSKSRPRFLSRLVGK